jgi:ubiquinone/menaquinone biosynthesis C-methylase UbiE
MIGRYYVKPILNQSSDVSLGLDRQHLESLIEKYRDYGKGRSYNQLDVDSRGKNTANQILAMRSAGSAKDFLEIGCGDGHIVGFIAAEGRSATGVDIDGGQFNQRYIKYGANLIRADASKLPFKDESFDFAFSYATFEHISDLDNVLSEVYRVLRPGGHLFVEFGPLYNSPYGLHAYYAVPVPYCQFLFERGMMDNYIEEIGQSPIRYKELNGWSLNQYRELWNRFDTKFKRIKYREWSWLKNLDLIRQYPECFRGRVDNIDDLFLSTIQTLLQKVNI